MLTIFIYVFLAFLALYYFFTRKPPNFPPGKSTLLKLQYEPMLQSTVCYEQYDNIGSNIYQSVSVCIYQIFSFDSSKNIDLDFKKVSCLQQFSSMYFESNILQGINEISRWYKCKELLQAKNLLQHSIECPVLHEMSSCTLPMPTHVLFIA